MKTLKFMAIVVLSAAIAFVLAYALAETVRQFIAIGVFGSMFMTVVAGAFDVKEKTRYDSIRHKMGRKSYGQAAIFLGTACVFVGTPKECEERADDLWHYGHQVRVEENIDGMEFSIL